MQTNCEHFDSKELIPHLEYLKRFCKMQENDESDDYKYPCDSCVLMKSCFKHISTYSEDTSLGALEEFCTNAVHELKEEKFENDLYYIDRELTFEKALIRLKLKERLSRVCWDNGNYIQLEEMIIDNDIVPIIYLYTFDGKISVWNISFDDILATDWYVEHDD